jgi:poly(A) polymerase
MPAFDQHLALHRADCLASHRQLTAYDFLQEKLLEVTPETIRPQPLLSGDDLIAAGLKPGPAFRQILEAVEDAQLEGRLPNREAALQFLRSQFPAATTGL